MTVLGFLVFFGCFAWFLWAVGKDSRKGLCVAVTVFVIMPQQLKLNFGGIADLTIQRLIVLCLLPYLPKLLREAPGRRRVPFFGGLMALALSQLISLANSLTVAASFKDFLSFTFEIFIFYAIVGLSIRNWNDVEALIRAVCRGLVVVAVLATIEKYSSFEAMATLTGPLLRGKDEGGVMATYPHRILLGYAMAMGVPLFLLLTEWDKTGRPRVLAWLSLILVVSACYFATSRGPWMGGALAAVGVSFLTGRESIRKLGIVLMLAVVVCLVRPGVWDTISGLCRQTFETDTVKGRSYEYRWILWHVAISEIKRSPERTLFGYGGRSTESMDLSSYFEKESGGLAIILGFTSWDNNLAADLIEFGVIGFTIEVFIYLNMIKELLWGWRATEGRIKNLLGIILGACGVYLFALTNVYMFSPQLNYLFWTLAAVGIAAVRLGSEPEQMGASAEELRHAEAVSTGQDAVAFDVL